MMIRLIQNPGPIFLKHFLFFVTTFSTSLLLLLSSPQSAWAQTKFHLNGDPNKPISFGLEIEVDPLGSNVLNYYYHPQAGLSENQWRALPLEEKQKLLKNIQLRENQYFQRLAERMVKADYTPLVRMSDTDPRFPETLPREYSGAYEFNGNKMIFYSLEDLEGFFSLFKAHFNYGDPQGHVVFPINDYPGLLGFVIFEHDRAFLTKLEEQSALLPPMENYSHFLLQAHNPFQDCRLEHLPAGNLYSHNLKIMDYDILHQLQLITQAISRKLKEQRPLRDFVDTKTPKYGGPVIRTFPYPLGLMGLEFREFDFPFEVKEIRTKTEFDHLKKTLLLTAKVLQTQGGLQNFEEFEKLQTTPTNYVDLVWVKAPGRQTLVPSDPQQFSMNQRVREKYGPVDLDQARLQEFLQSANPAIQARAQKLQEGIQSGAWFAKLWKNPYLFKKVEFPKSALYFPMKDWKNTPPLKNLPEEEKQKALARLELATLNYMETLQRHINEYRTPTPEILFVPPSSRGFEEKLENGEIEFEEEKHVKEIRLFMDKMRFAMTRWASEAQLSPYFHQFFEEFK